MALEDGGSTVASGSGIGQGLKIAVAAFGGGGGRRTCANGIGVEIGIEVVKAKGLLLQQWRQRWQGWQERTHLMQGTYIDGDGTEIGVLRWQWLWQQCRCKDGAGKARAKGG